MFICKMYNDHKISGLTLIQGLQKNIFLTSFYAFPKNVVKDKFVARELPDKTHFSDFKKTKKFSLSLPIFRFLFNTQSSEVLLIGLKTFAPPPFDSKNRCDAFVVKI